MTLELQQPVDQPPQRAGVSAADSALAAIQALRPKQWVKNALIGAAPIFSMRFLDVALWPKIAAATLCFCLLSSTGYLYNDIATSSRIASIRRSRAAHRAPGACPCRRRASRW